MNLPTIVRWIYSIVFWRSFQKNCGLKTHLTGVSQICASSSSLPGLSHLDHCNPTAKYDLLNIHPKTTTSRLRSFKPTVFVNPPPPPLTLQAALPDPTWQFFSMRWQVTEDLNSHRCQMASVRCLEKNICRLLLCWNQHITRYKQCKTPLVERHDTWRKSTFFWLVSQLLWMWMTVVNVNNEW